MKKGEEGEEKNPSSQIPNVSPVNGQEREDWAVDFASLSVCCVVNSSPPSSDKVLSWLLVSKLLCTHISYLI